MSTVGTTKRVIGQPDTFGGHYWAPGDHTGPTSYTTGGYALDPRAFGFNNTIWEVTPGVDNSGIYMLVGSAKVPGRSTINAVWINIDSGVQVPNGHDLSGITVRIGALGE